MTAKEKDKIDQLIELIEGQVLPEIENIKLGIYGDEKNEIPGLLKMNKQHHERLRKLEGLRDKIIWIGTALVISAQMVYDFLKAKLFGA